MEKLLEVKGLKKTFYKKKIPFAAVDNVSFDLNKGECLGLVGESGCGKSTTAKIITHLTVPDSGSVLLEGAETLHVKGRQERELYRKVQMVFQTPQDSFDPRCSLGDGIMEEPDRQQEGADGGIARVIHLTAVPGGGFSVLNLAAAPGGGDVSKGAFHGMILSPGGRVKNKTANCRR